MIVTESVDVFVVGAGMAGILSTYRVSLVGLTLLCVDVASDVGGADTGIGTRVP